MGRCENKIFHRRKGVKRIILLTELYFYGRFFVMKLSAYLERISMSRKEFADHSGIPLSTIYRLLDEPDVIPDGINIARVIKATKGEVGVLDLVPDKQDMAG